MSDSDGRRGAKSFVAGADIGEMSTLTKAEGEAFGKKGNDVFRKLETFRFLLLQLLTALHWAAAVRFP